MTKKFRLESKNDDDYTIIGIVSHQRDYRLIWSINEKMNLRLVKFDDLKIFQDRKKEFNTFSFYYYNAPETFKTYYFISNSGENGPLFPEYKQINFFFLIKGNVTKNLEKEITKALADNEYIMKTYPVSLTSVKESENFFLDMEMSMIDMLKKKKH